MNRRNFSKLLAGTVTAAGVHGISEAERKPAAQEAPVSAIPPSGGSDSWELVILDAAPAHSTETGGTGAADIDGDGKTELIIAANGALLWYRPSTSERGVVARGYFNVGIALEDIDQDGHKEIVVGKKLERTWGLCWYKFGASLHDPWQQFTLHPACTGDLDDVAFAAPDTE